MLLILRWVTRVSGIVSAARGWRDLSGRRRTADTSPRARWKMVRPGHCFVYGPGLCPQTRPVRDVYGQEVVLPVKHRLLLQLPFGSATLGRGASENRPRRTAEIVYHTTRRIVNDNPWHRLPDNPPFVLPDEESAVRNFNVKARPVHFLHIDDILPEPFVGDPSAPVVVLGTNPGFNGERTIREKSEPGFVARLRANLLHQSSDSPFAFLAPDVSGRHRQWWEDKLKHLIAHFGPGAVAKSILAVEFFPYPSHRYGHGRLALPSQQYSFDLVRNAIKRKAVIVLTRGERRWLREMPELVGDNLVTLEQPFSAPISPGNCCGSGYQKVVEAIKRGRS